MAIDPNQFPHPLRIKRRSLGLTLVCLLSLLTGPAAAASALEAKPLVDYSATELATLTSLQELIPKERFDIEVVIFKHRDTSHALLAPEQTSAEINADPIRRPSQDALAYLSKLQDPREPLLLEAPRRLPSQFYGLLPRPEISDLSRPFESANSDYCWALRNNDTRSDDMEANLTADALLGSSSPLGRADAEAMDPPVIVAHSRHETALHRATTLDLADDSTPKIDPLGRGDDWVALNQSIGESTAMAAPEQTGLVPKSQTQVIATPYLTLINTLTRFQKRLQDSEFQEQPEDALSLTQQAQQLERSGDFEVLDHFAWQQSVPPRDQPQHIYVRVGDTLRGTLAITLGRYLHTAATLWLQPDTDLTLVRGEEEREADQATYASQAYALMNQSRRMRSGELHYFDHPLFGMLVWINPVEHDDATKAQFEAFKAQLEQSAL